jgi:hypothetical protein
MVLALLTMALIPAIAFAAKPTGFTATGLIAVSAPPVVVPAGISGRVRITSEASAGFTIPGPGPLDGALLFMQQKSNELFSSFDLTTAVAINGSSVGTFQVVHPTTFAVIASGRYHLSVSNGPGCQILSTGNLSTTGGGANHGRLTVTSCLNFSVPPPPFPAIPTFWGTVTFAGTPN